MVYWASELAGGTGERFVSVASELPVEARSAEVRL